MTRTPDKECLVLQQLSHEGLGSKTSGDVEKVCFGMVSQVLLYI